MMRPSRRLTTFLVGVLCFALILLVPNTAANAASETKSSNPTPIAMDDDGVDGVFSGIRVTPNCQGSAWWIATRTGGGSINYSLGYKAGCSQLAARAGLAERRLVRLEGVDANGAACKRSTTVATDKKGLSSWNEGGSVPLGSAADPTYTGGSGIPDLFNFGGGVLCKPTRILSDNSGGSGNVWQGNLSLGAVPTFAGVSPHTGKCAKGTPESVTVVDHVKPVSGSYKGTEWNVVDVKYSATEPGTGTWVLRPIIVPAAFTPPGDGTTVAQSSWQNTIMTNSTGTVTVRQGNSAGGQNGVFYSLSADWSTYKIIGYTLYETTVRSSTPGPLPTSQTVGSWARTDPAKCSFYFGPKAFDDLGSNADEPYGADTSVGNSGEPVVTDPTPPAVTDPVTPKEDACQFKLSDPSSWLSGGMCAAVGLLGEIMRLLINLVQAVIGLPAKIVTGLLDGFAALFVPDQAVMDGVAGTTRASWNSSSVGTMFTSLGSVFSALSFPGNGSCKGPKWDLKVGTMVDQTMYPLDACSGATATAATLFRAGIMLSVILGTAYACLRIMGSAVGLNLNGIGQERA